MYYGIPLTYTFCVLQYTTVYNIHCTIPRHQFFPLSPRDRQPFPEDLEHPLQASVRKDPTCSFPRLEQFPEYKYHYIILNCIYYITS